MALEKRTKLRYEASDKIQDKRLRERMKEAQGEALTNIRRATTDSFATVLKIAAAPLLMALPTKMENGMLVARGAQGVVDDIKHDAAHTAQEGLHFVKAFAEMGLVSGQTCAIALQRVGRTIALQHIGRDTLRT